MENAVFGLLGALAGGVLGFVGSLFSTSGKSKDTSKDVLTRTVTNERAQWRKDLRELAGEFVENALRVVANAPGACIYRLEKQRVLIRLRLNPNPKHELDASILKNIIKILEYAKASDNGNLTVSLSEFEKDIQAILKQEWDKSKREAETGALDAISTEEKDEANAKSLFNQFIDVKPEEVSLKFVFDNIRNYSIAAAVIAAGFYLFSNGSQVNQFPGSGIVFGMLFVLIGAFAYVLNLTQAILSLIKLGARFIPYFIISMLMFLGSSELILVLIKQLMQKG